MTHDHPHDHAGVPHQHKARAPAFARVYVITCSDSRTAATDEGGRIIKSMLADRGHVIAGSAIVPDEPSRIAQELQRARETGAQVALITGGTGITSRDSTFEAVSAAIARPLPGFGELFRMLSFEAIRWGCRTATRSRGASRWPACSAPRWRTAASTSSSRGSARCSTLWGPPRAPSP